MSLTLEDNIISALDDYAEYVTNSGFSGAISQDETVEFILESIERRIPVYNNKKSRLYFQPNYNPIKAHKNGYRLAIRDLRKNFGLVKEQTNE